MDFNFTPTAIGSLPHQDAARAVGLALKYLPAIPFWPQLPQRSFREGMAAQFSEGLPGVIIDEQNKKVYIDTSKDLDKPITAFYEKYLNNDVAGFAPHPAISNGISTDKCGTDCGLVISPSAAAGLHQILSTFRPSRDIQFIKGQVTGPVTFGALVTDENGKALMHHPQLADVLVKCLIMKARWQIGQLKRCTPRIIIFLDEPYLMGYGSAYIPLARETVVSQITEIINEIHNQGALAGIHCCGNTDWSVILATPLDILNFDAYDFMDKLTLYPTELQRFLGQGGTIAWGIVPAGEVATPARRSLGAGGESRPYRRGDIDKPIKPDEMASRLKQGITTLTNKGVDKKRLIGQSIITPACGLGMLSEAEAESRLKLLPEIAAICRQSITE
ncbi:MAG: hypothetical protein HY762_04470 [Planctomycetes bacterium]|nr:hypothetical protein [Planctomycetota bacterium]